MSNASSAEHDGHALGYLLKHASARMTVIADAALERFDIDSKDLGVLRVLADREAASQQQVAETLGVDRTTMVSLLDVLEQKNIVSRRPDPADRRRNVVELTPSGRRMLPRADAAYARAEAELLGPVSAADAARFRRTLTAILGG